MFEAFLKFIKLFFRLTTYAAIDVAADEIVRASRGNRRGHRSYTSYNRMPYSGPTRDVFEKHPRTLAEDNRMERERINRVRRQQAEEFQKNDNIRFHDVLMVAFDITGPNAAVAYEWLQNHMPAAREYHSDDVDIDAWWIADDAAGDSDCDSAVFVSKGNQAAARALLREHGLVE